MLNTIAGLPIQTGELLTASYLQEYKNRKADNDLLRSFLKLFNDVFF